VAGTLANVVDMPFMLHIPNMHTTAVELARPDLDQSKAAMVVESTPVAGSG
jgi:predicted thioesterase